MEVHLHTLVVGGVQLHHKMLEKIDMRHSTVLANGYYPVEHSDGELVFNELNRTKY